MGDHTDYNGGVALPMAIDLATEAVFAPLGGANLHIVSAEERDPVDLSLIAGGDGDLGPPGWGRLAAAVVGALGPVPGGEVLVSSSIPIGAGLSSSAAFSVALALSLGAPPDPKRLAVLCRDAEARAGADVGLMDPFVIVAAHEGSALLIDFEDLAASDVAVPDDAEFTVVHSGAVRQLASSAYAERRAECARAAALIGVLGHATTGAADAISDPLLRRRARHVVSECRRVHEFVVALGSDDLSAAGALMDESHRSLRDDFGVSTPAIDALVEQLAATPGVHGARLTGGGFGGCVVALSERGALDPGAWRHGAWRVRPSAGARRHALGERT